MSDRDADRQDDVDTSAQAEPDRKPAPRPPQRLVNQARFLGFDEAEISQYSTSDLLNAINAEISHRALTKPAPAPAAEKEPEIDWGQDEDGNPLTEAQLAKHVVKDKRELHALKLEFGKYSKEVKEALAEMKEREQKREAAEQQRQANAYWDAFDRLCAKHPDLFGKGSRAKLDPKSHEYKRRASIAAACTDTTRPLEEQFEEALEAVHGRKLNGKRKPAPEPEEDEDDLPDPEPAVTKAKSRGGKEVFGDDLESDRKAWDKSNGTSPGSHRRSPEIDEDSQEARQKKAAKEIARIKRDRGITANGHGREEESLLPD